MSFSDEDFNDLKAEYLRQTEKHKRLPADALRCQAVLSEECGEVARAVLDTQPVEELKAELLQVACFALRWRGSL